MTPRPRPRWPAVALIAGGIIIFLWRLHVLRHGMFEFDEFEFGRAAWQVRLGRLPYRDFWEHHFPTFSYVLAPVFAWVGPRINALLYLRLFCFALEVPIGILLYRIGKELYGRRVAWLALALLFSFAYYVHEVTQVRPDHLMTIGGLCAIWFSIRAVQTQSLRQVLWAGLGLGLLIGTTQRGLLLAAVELPLWVTALVLFGPSWKTSLKAFAVALGGALVIPVAMILPNLLGGSMHEFLEYNLFESLRVGRYVEQVSQPLRVQFGASFREYPLFWAAACSGGAMALFHAAITLRQGREALAQRKRRLLRAALALSVALGFVHLTTLRVAYHYYPTALMPWCALLGAVPLAELARGARGMIGAVALPAIILIVNAFGCFHYGHFELKNDNRVQLDTISYMLRATSPGDAILDGCGMPLYRESAHPRWLLPPHIGYGIKSGKIPPSIKEALEASRAKVVVLDSWTRFAAGKDQAWITDRYVPVGGHAMIAGAALFPNESAQPFETIVPGRYLLESVSGAELPQTVSLDLDGAVLPGQRKVDLEKGWHELRILGATEPVWLHLSTPADEDVEARELLRKYLYIPGATHDMRVREKQEGQIDQ